MNPLHKTLQDLKAERGYKLLEPWRYSERSLGLVVPIIREEYGERKYLLVEEARNLVELEDSGAIDKVIARSHTSKPVLARGGVMVSGKTQPRALRHTIVIMPGEHEITLDVRCVSASTPIRPKAELVACYSVPSGLYSRLLKGSQADLWEGISFYLRRAEHHLADENLEKFVRELARARREIAEVIERFPARENQVGVFILDEKGVYALEMFDHPDSWKALARDIARKYSEELAKQAEFFPFKVDFEAVKMGIHRFIDRLMQCREHLLQRGANFKVAMLEGDGIIGEYAELQGEAIYIAACREEAPPEELKGLREPEPSFYTPRFMASWLFRELAERRREKPALHVITAETSRETRKIEERELKIRQILTHLKQKPSTWSELKEALKMSDATLARYLDELLERKLIAKELRENGKIAYYLTAKGHYTLQPNNKP